MQIAHVVLQNFVYMKLLTDGVRLNVYKMKCINNKNVTLVNTG